MNNGDSRSSFRGRHHQTHAMITQGEGERERRRERKRERRRERDKDRER